MPVKTFEILTGWIRRKDQNQRKGKREKRGQDGIEPSSPINVLKVIGALPLSYCPSRDNTKTLTLIQLALHKHNNARPYSSSDGGAIRLRPNR